MSKPSELPIFIQLADRFIGDISAGRLPHGARLAPERQLAAELGVSVGTLRKALRELERAGLLNRIQGSGNYVQANAEKGGIYAMFRLELAGGGGVPRAEVLEVAVTRKPDDVAEFGTSGDATRIRRLRRLDSVPVAIEEIWLDAAVGTLDRGQIGESLYLTYASALGLRIERAEDRVSVGVVPDWAPSIFSLAPGQLGGYVARRSWSSLPAPVEFSRSWFDPEKAHYVQHIS